MGFIFLSASFTGYGSSTISHRGLHRACQPYIDIFLFLKLHCKQISSLPIHRAGHILSTRYIPQCGFIIPPASKAQTRPHPDTFILSKLASIRSCSTIFRAWAMLFVLDIASRLHVLPGPMGLPPPARHTSIANWGSRSCQVGIQIKSGKLVFIASSRAATTGRTTSDSSSSCTMPYAVLVLPKQLLSYNSRGFTNLTQEVRAGILFRVPAIACLQIVKKTMVSLTSTNRYQQTEHPV